MFLSKVETSGLKALNRSLSGVRKVRDVADLSIDKTSFEVQEEIEEGIELVGAVASGDMLGSVIHNRMPGRSIDQVEGSISVDTDYAKYVERGTVFIRARRFMRFAQRAAPRIFNDNVEFFVQKHLNRWFG